MSDDLMQLGTYLQSQLIGTLGLDIRLNAARDAQPDMINLIPIGEWRPSAWTFGKVAFEFPAIQIYVRDTKPSEALSKANQIYSALNRLGRTTMDGTTWHCIRAMKPIFIGSDGRDRYQYSVNIYATKAPNS